MAIDPVVDFLNKQIATGCRVVTYRSLSRCLGIHVNDAKNALASYHEKHKEDSSPIHAMYLVSGTLPPIKGVKVKKTGDESSVSTEEELISSNRMILVGEQALQLVKESMFQEVISAHIYSLSAEQITDTGMLTAPTATVREKDNRSKSGTNPFGRIVGPVIQEPAKLMGSKVKEAKPINTKLSAPTIHAKTSMSTISTKPSTSTIITKPSTFIGELKESQEPLRKANSLQTFLVNKEQGGRSEKKQPKIEEKDSHISETSTSNNEQQQTTMSEINSSKSNAYFFGPKSKANAKSTIKRVPDPDAKKDTSSSVELDRPQKEESEQDKPKKQIRIQKRTVLSDDEDEDQMPLSRRKKRKSVLDERSQDERSLRAMMEVGDDAVSIASKDKTESCEPNRIKKANQAEEDQQEEEEEAVETMEEEEEFSQGRFIDKKPRKARKVKTKEKDIPTDSKGRKKRKVTKSRKEKDKKGRTITVDYSSWESDSEDEANSTKSDSKLDIEISKKEKIEALVKTSERKSAKEAPTKLRKVAKAPAIKGDIRGFFGAKTT